MTRGRSWALFFLGLCLSRLALADEPASIPPAATEQVQQAVEARHRICRPKAPTG